VVSSRDLATMPPMMPATTEAPFGIRDHDVASVSPASLHLG